MIYLGLILIVLAIASAILGAAIKGWRRRLFYVSISIFFFLQVVYLIMSHRLNLAEPKIINLLGIITVIIAVFAAALSLTVKGWRRRVFYVAITSLLILQIAYILLSQRTVIFVKDESLDLFGYEISGSMTGMQTKVYHDAVPRIQEIVKHIYAKDYSNAERMCDSLIEDYPNFAGAYFWKGVGAILQNQNAKCEKLWTKAAEVEPQNISYSLLYRDLGIISMKMKNRKGAVAAFRLALGVALTTDEMRVAEKEQGKRPFERVSTDECYFLMAKAYAEGEQSDSANYYREKAILENPEWKEKWNDTVRIVIP
jgi:tetratricopeptide (TPR) repeat protein